jgi:hypothetical protein
MKKSRLSLIVLATALTFGMLAPSQFNQPQQSVAQAAKLKHTVTINGKRHASKYTINQMRSKYNLKSKTYHDKGAKAVYGRYPYANKVQGYTTKAYSGDSHATNYSYKGRFIIFETWRGGNLTVRNYVNLTTGSRHKFMMPGYVSF